jgi:very-short-patch-repair endonuclease
VAAPTRNLTLGEIARSQHGVFTRRQAASAGFTRNEIDGRIRRVEWTAVDYGVYRSAETPSTWRQRLMAACLAGPAVASHRSAAALWSFPDFAEDVVEVTAVRHRRRTSDDVIWHESVRLDERDLTAVDQIPITSATRTVIDLGAVVGREILLSAIDDALRRKLTSVERLDNELEHWGTRRRGSGNVRRAVALRRDAPVPESPLESEFDELIRRFGLPTPSRQWVIRDEHGDAVARVDFAYPVARVAIEVDGLRWHGSLPDQKRDARRQAKIEAAGWRVLRFTAQDIRRRPDQVRDAVFSALALWDASLDLPHDGERRNQ